jgi:holo-[acyl-carrier protein] synthase
MTLHIAGVGLELVDCARVGRLIERHGEDFLRHVFTRQEIAHCSRRSQSIQHFAARWAAKQAVVKAMGMTPDRHFCWCDVEIRGTLKQGLRVGVGGTVRSHCVEHRIAETKVSAAFSRFAATACAIALTRFDDPA